MNTGWRVIVSGEYQRREENLGVLVEHRNATLYKGKYNPRIAE